jgi:methylthioribose-1-phosphate isomerase
MEFETLKWVGGVDGHLELLDQRRLPAAVEKLPCTTVEQLYEAIRTLAVRGAPAIGAAAAYGVCIAVQKLPPDCTLSKALDALKKACDHLKQSRPTAVNLSWALDRMSKKGAAFAVQHPDETLDSLKQCLLDESHTICAEDKAMCEAIGRYGQSLIPDGGAVLTHCNAGALATAGIGTALAPMYIAHQAGRHFRVYIDETRPLLQGSRLTAWELAQAGIDTVLVCDSMPASLMAAGKINAVITGADRIAANGDTANKIGTLGLSIAAKHYGIPFYVAAPSSTFDLTLADGSQIPIETRTSEEICTFGQSTVAPDGIRVYNPAFDVTPAGNITAIITEKGIIEPVTGENIRKHIKGMS